MAITFDEISKANATIKTTDIKGKDYAEVNQRIKAFRMVFPLGFIHTEMTSNKGKDAGTSFFPCIAWGVAGETIVRYCNKGQRLAVGGAMQSRTYESNGKKGTAWEVIVNEFDFIEPKSEETPKEEAPELVEINPDEADLPF